jgi:hypothetical protein
MDEESSESSESDRRSAQIVLTLANPYTRSVRCGEDRLLSLDKQKQIMPFRGKPEWHGNLDALRSDS